jgi:hypothetical protein
MIRIALADAAYDAIARRCLRTQHVGPCSAIVEAAVADRMRAMRRPSESYNQVILRLVELETSDLK